MDKRTVTLGKVSDYKTLHSLFLHFCDELAQTFPSGNDFGIEIGTGDNTTRNITILNEACRMRFDIRTEPAPTLGRILYERLLPREETRRFLTIFFDHLGNATETPEHKTWLHSLKNRLDITNSLAIRILEEFFKDAALMESSNEGSK